MIIRESFGEHIYEYNKQEKRIRGEIFFGDSFRQFYEELDDNLVCIGIILSISLRDRYTDLHLHDRISHIHV